MTDSMQRRGSAMSVNDEVRTIETGVVSSRYARGWHCLGPADQFRDGKPHSVEAFGGKLVVFASQSTGEINVLDAYCRHMGGDLSRGTIKGDNVACPFHDWRWGGDGRCKEIPYARRVPLRARTAAWPTMVHGGLLFVWNDPEGNPPIPEQMIPAIPGAEDAEWTSWAWKSTLIDTNVREIIDNVVDMAHFFYVHFTFPQYFKNVFQDHIAIQYMNGQRRQDVIVPGRPATSESVAAYYGPSFMIDELKFHYEDHTSEITLINAHYPVTPTQFVLHLGIIVKKGEHLDDAAAAELVEKNMVGASIGFDQDIEIWRNKTRIDNPLLCEEDGPVYQLRRWYEQFYVDVADVEPAMTDRFEFEIDTERPVAAWTKQVEEARLAAAVDDPSLEASHR